MSTAGSIETPFGARLAPTLVVQGTEARCGSDPPRGVWNVMIMEDRTHGS
jgi:hypothetical protein